MAQTKAEKEAKKAEQKAKLDAFLADFGKDLAHESPEGFVRQSGDIAGTWVSATPIIGIPRSAKLMDSQMDDKKAAALVLFELTKPCIIDAEGEFRTAEEGEIVGVWYKPGMRALRWLRDVEVFMKMEPESKWKDTGKDSAMITYEVTSLKKGLPMMILEDYRETSAPFVDGNNRTVGLHDLEPVQRAIQQVPI